MNILITNAHPYLLVHEAFRLEKIDAWAREFGFMVIGRVTKNNSIDYSKYNFTNTVLTSNHLDDCVLKQEFTNIIKHHKPKKIMNNLEIFVPWHLVESDAEKIYFFRSCASKVKKVFTEHDDNSERAANAIRDYNHYVELEEQYIRLSDSFITDSPNSKSTISTEYPFIKNVDIGLEYVDPKKYLNLKISDSFSNDVYTVGRTDFQKGLHNIKYSDKYKVHVIGKNELHSDEFKNENFVFHGELPFENYSVIIDQMNFGLFPSMWESNGYAVQECLAMGKIPIVQRGSGGNERLIVNRFNGFIIDFKSEHWEDYVSSLSWPEIKSMQDNARSTLTINMFRTSLEKWASKLQ